MKFKVLFLVILFINGFVSAQNSLTQLQKQIEHISTSHQATVGVSVIGPDGKQIIAVNDEKHFAMQSVFKFHLGLAILHLVDEGKLSLDQKIVIKQKDIQLNTHSPMRDAQPGQDITISIKELIRYSVALSDNNACDVLFELAGGTKKVNEYIHSLGVKDIQIVATEREMATDWNVQFTNWSTPSAASLLLEKYWTKNLLSKPSHDYLWECMTQSVKTDRIKGLLPESLVVGHKAGTSGKNDEGVRAAFNDIGIVTLPDGIHFSIVVFINNSKEDDAINARIIAEITKLCFDYFAK